MRRRNSRKAWWMRADSLLITLVLVVAALAYSFFKGDYGPLKRLANELGLTEIAAQLPLDTPLSAQKLPPATQGPRFLMYNVKNYFVMGEAQRAPYMIYPKKEEAKEAVADVIASASPDIVGLVEMGGKVALTDLQKRLEKRGLYFPHVRVLERQGEARALALLSRYPIKRDSSRAQYALYGQQRRKMLRGILDVAVELEDGRIFRIVGAHLKSRVSDQPAAARSLRAHEARSLAQYLARSMKQEPQIPVLVYGDWNDGPADASLSSLSQEAGLSRIKAADTQGDDWTLYYKKGHEYYIFDQLYANKVLEKRLGRKLSSGVIEHPSNKTASDHRAVWCELR